jgi:hypothetical protein
MQRTLAAASRARSLLLGCLLACSFNAVAQEGTVKVGSQTKQASGIIVSMEAGDVACYVNLKSDKGTAFREMANFEICEQERALKGKRVNLTYEMGKVLADSCQGNPDCKKTQTVVLIKTAKVAAAGAAPASAPATAKAAAGGQKSFCTPNEEVVFACRTGQKMVSVCASRDASPKSGYVQYRFGKPDSAEPLEMLLPADQPVPPRAASGESVPFAGGGGAWIRFRKGDFAYVPYSGIGRWGPRGETQEKAGVAVERGGKRIANVKCAGAATGSLGPDWLAKAGVRPGKNEDFDFPD